jgi:stage V sporulation protein D (sporulation-specific penicillin-binding protein)
MYLQLFSNEELKQKAATQQFKVTTITPKRGTIFDSQMNELAVSATAWTVFLVPVNIESEEQGRQIAKDMSEMLGVDEEKIFNRSQVKNSYYQIVKKRLEDADADKVRQYILDNDLASCIKLEEDVKRYYPFGTLASTVLGFVGEDNTGLYGIEAYYNKTLSGTPGRISSAKNAWGSDMPYKYEQMFEAEDGSSLVLTINSVVQHYVEKYLEIAVEEHDVRNRAFCIVMEIKTGRILAMATKPDFDPNSPFEIYDPSALERLEQYEPESDDYYTALKAEQERQWQNKAVSTPYEPGSVSKIITAAAALEEGAISLKSSFDCTGIIHVAGNNIKCHKYPRNHGVQTLLEAIKNSCNPAFIEIGQRLGGSNYYKYFCDFGLNTLTGIDIPGEADNSGLVHSQKELMQENMSALSSSAFGQTYKVTPIQLLTAVSAAMNGGNLMKPYIVEQVLDSKGNVVEFTTPTVVRQVISQQTSEIMRDLCEQVVYDGSGRYAKVTGYRIGGKTGTSEKLDSGDESLRISSFFGFAPADDPEIAVLLALDEPHNDSVYGSVIAAPVVGKILAEVLPYVGIEPEYTDEELKNIEISTPYVIGQKIYEATTTMLSYGLKAETVGNGETVIKQIPAVGAPIPKGSTVMLYTDDDSLNETVTVPNVLGFSGQVASRTLSNKGLNIKITGLDITETQTKAVRQTPEAGEKVPRGTVVTVEFVSTESLE